MVRGHGLAKTVNADASRASRKLWIYSGHPQRLKSGAINRCELAKPSARRDFRPTLFFAHFALFLRLFLLPSLFSVAPQPHRLQ